MSVKSQALAPLDEALTSIGFNRTSKRTYAYQNQVAADDTVYGTLFLNVASKRSVAGSFEVSPVVGIFRADIRLLIDGFADSISVAAFGPVLQSPIGYLMPANEFETWTFRAGAGADNFIEAELVAAAVATYGMAFFSRYCGLPEILAGLLQDRLGTKSEYDIPAVLLLLDRKQEAREYVASQVAAVGDRTDPAAQMYLEFAERFCA